MKNTIAALLVVAIVGTFSTTIIQQSAEGVIDEINDRKTEQSKAPTVVSGDNIYVAWWNGTAGLPDVQTDVMFRASTDIGQTFGNRINLSNTTDADSADVEIAAEGDTVVVSWWETNQTSDVPVARISTDAGETFGPMIRLGMNGTIDSTAEEEVAAEAGEL